MKGSRFVPRAQAPAGNDDEDGGGNTKIAPKTQLSQGENKGGGAQQQTATNVVVNAQPPGGGGGGAGGPGLFPIGFRRPWFAEMFGCFDNMAICACATFCPCIYMLSTYQTLGQSCLVPLMMPPPYHLTVLRTFVRSEEEIDGHICNDLILTCICYQCILCQIRREYDFVLRFRGRRIGFNQFGPMTTF